MEFLRILLLANITSLTPQPIDLFGTMEFKPQKPLKAITSGSSLEINISSMIKHSNKGDILEARNAVKEAFPAGSIEALLISNIMTKIPLYYNGASAYSGNQIVLILDTDDGVPTDVEFEKLIITSHINLKSITISWKNYKN